LGHRATDGGLAENDHSETKNHDSDATEDDEIAESFLNVHEMLMPEVVVCEKVFSLFPLFF
jgi:hypothetical protein